ncbi:MAG: NfeD family protein [Oscillospiraceae bacterium]|nr:NfeD family protein [Oscillospiraceae bacterium]
MNLYAVIWLSLAVLLAALEAGTAQFVSIWFSLAAVVATLLALVGAPVGLQIIVFVVVSAVLVAALRPVARRLARPGRTRPAPTPTNADRAVGETVVVLRDVGGGETGQAAGEVKVNGLVWSAVTPDGAVIRAGERARVLAIEGAKLIVEKSAGKNQTVLEEV